MKTLSVPDSGNGAGVLAQKSKKFLFTNQKMIATCFIGQNRDMQKFS
jgi:hypothetical protein